MNRLMMRRKHDLLCGWAGCVVLLLNIVNAAPNGVGLQGLAREETEYKIAAITQVTENLATTAPARALEILQALADGNLSVLNSAGQKMPRIVIVNGEQMLDAESLSPLRAGADDTLEAIVVNNRVRSVLESALATLRLFAPEVKMRRQAATALVDHVDATMLPLIDKALQAETDKETRDALHMARALLNITAGDALQRLAAVKVLGTGSDPKVRQVLKNIDVMNEPDEAVRSAAALSLRAVERRLAWGDNLASLFAGVSLGSILLLAALGLAISYGVMGVINMAHGELLMIGAYATWGMQTFFRGYLPHYQDVYLLAAIPAGFIAAALIGILMERLVIRHLYGRSLETLLATFGISLFLMQLARTLFGANNVEVANPSWMSGSVVVLSNFLLPWNRLCIIVFSLAMLAAIWALLNLTRFGMFVRAVTQNRSMAGCVGVHTGRVDTLAFGLGAGIAGLGGVALSQLSNVGPDMGQGYIIDSFMVVVLGGVGQMAGTVWAALGLGVFTKLLEGWQGAVIAKILALVFIIIFIQKRPQGIFALKGRFVEA